MNINISQLTSNQRYDVWTNASRRFSFKRVMLGIHELKDLKIKRDGVKYTKNMHLVAIIVPQKSYSSKVHMVAIIVPQKTYSSEIVNGNFIWLCTLPSRTFKTPLIYTIVQDKYQQHLLLNKKNDKTKWTCCCSEEKTVKLTKEIYFVSTRGTSPKFLPLKFHILKLEWCCYFFFSVFGFQGGEITGSTWDLINNEILYCQKLREYKQSASDWCNKTPFLSKIKIFFRQLNKIAQWFYHTWKTKQKVICKG